MNVEHESIKIANKYETTEFIEAGETGLTYKGIDLTTNEIIAIKVLKTELTKNKDFMFHFVEEINNVIKLDHPNIVKIKNFIQDENSTKAFVISEFVDGRSLTQILEENERLPMSESISILEQVAIALDYAHSQNVIHRAIKPKDIMISKDNQVKVKDFAISKAAATAWITMTGTFTGNVEYMSPEQAEGEKIDNRCDIYSLGIVAYELLTNEVPFKRDGISVLSIAMKHINTKPEPPSLINSEIPKWLDYIILKCLEKRPDERFQTGKELYEIIRSGYRAHVEQELKLKTPVKNILEEVETSKEKEDSIQQDEKEKNKTEDTIHKKEFFNYKRDIKAILGIVIGLELLIIIFVLYMYLS